jgi:hypothetical protein
VGWAELWQKGKENHTRSWSVIARTRNFTIGAIFAGAGGFGLYSDTMHQIHGRPATATLMAHIQECTVEYQRIGEQERKEQLPCELAEAFQKHVGSNKVKLSRDLIARVRFPLQDGRVHEANVDDIKLGSTKLAIGATLPVFYAPDNPAEVRAVMSWARIKVQLILLALGLPFLWFGFGGSLTGLFGWAFRGRSSEETVYATSEHLAAVAMQMSERSDSDRVAGNPAAQTAVNSFSRPTGSAPRASFGLRNR